MPRKVPNKQSQVCKADVIRITANKKAMVLALVKTRHNIGKACQMAGISRTTHAWYYANDPKYAEAVDNSYEVIIDNVEQCLLDQVEDQVSTSTIYFLKSKGKKRGWGEEITINNNVPIILQDHDGNNLMQLGTDAKAT